MKKIYFLIIDAYNLGGDTRVISLIANKMTENNEVTILSIFGSELPPKLYFNPEITIKNLFVNRLFSIKKHFMKIRKRIMNILINEEIDVLIVGSPSYTPLLYPHIKRKKTKIIVWDHASFSNSGKIFGLSWFGRKISAKYSDAIVVITKEDRLGYMSKYKIDHVYQIYNPIDTSIIQSNYNVNSKKIISAGRLVHDKGYDMLIEAMQIIIEDYSDWTLDIYGSGELDQELKVRTKDNGLNNNIFFKGEVKDLYNRYKDYSIYVSSSRTESFGMTIIEALMNNLPVVSFDCDNGPREILTNVVNGYLAEKNNINKMAETIKLLIQDRELRLNLSKNSKFDLDKFGLDNIYKKWLELLDVIKREK